MARRRTNADIRLARQRAAVRFGPERSTIKALISDAGARLGSDLSAANAGSKSAVHFANAARKPTTTIFNSARSATDAARQDVEAAFGRLGGAADPFRAATSREQAGARQRSALARAAALNDLTSRTLEAKAAGLSASNQARAGFRQDTRDLGKRLRDLGDRQGNFVAQEAATIAENRANRLVPIRVARIKTKAEAARDRRKAREQRALEGIKQKGRLGIEKYKTAHRPAKTGGGSAPGLGGNKPATRAELRGFEAAFKQAHSFAQQYRGQRDPRSKARSDLTRGVASTPGRPNRVPAIKNNLALSVALDMAYDGHVSRANARTMKQYGLRVRDIRGAVSYSDWLRKRSSPMSSGGGGGPHGTGRL